MSNTIVTVYQSLMVFIVSPKVISLLNQDVTSGIRLVSFSHKNTEARMDKFHIML